MGRENERTRTYNEKHKCIPLALTMVLALGVTDCAGNNAMQSSTQNNTQSATQSSTQTFP